MDPQQGNQTFGAALEQYQQELLRQNYAQSGFSIQNVRIPETGAPIPPAVWVELIRFHFALLKEHDPELTISRYLSRFPRHKFWEADLRKTHDCTQMVTVAHREREYQPFRVGDGVKEFACSPLARLAPSLQRELRSLMSIESYSRGDAILTEGCVGDRLMVVTSGMIEIISTPPGQPPAILAAVVVGDVLGEMSLIGDRPCTATAVAVGKVNVLSLPATDFHRLRESHPELAHLITEIVADRLGQGQLDALSSKSLNGYIIRRLLGRGGMSIVYDAVQESTGKRVALKMMSHRLVYDERSRSLFNSEAAIVASFQHENIPQIYERFDDFGTSFMAIEYVDGNPLSTLIREGGKLPDSLALSVLGQLSRALHYAHSAGVVHRDVKPSNCLLKPDGMVKLMDFGLSVRFQMGDQGHGGLMGTPAYMAPEQVAGQGPQPAADWFSLGLTIFELVTGRRVLHPSNVFALSDMYKDWDPRPLADSLTNDVIRQFVLDSLQFDPQKRRIQLDQLQQLPVCTDADLLATILRKSDVAVTNDNKTVTLS